MNKKTIVSASKNTITKLKVLAKEKENVRGKLAITAKKKERVRRKLEVTAGTLRLKANQLAITAKKKERVRRKLEVTAKEKETVRSNLSVKAEKLRLKAKQLAVLAKENESIKQKLEATDEKLAAAAREKEEVRKRLVVTAEKLAVTAKEVESANKELRLLGLAKDEFVSVASHQLRTPLTALKGYLGMLLAGDAGPINNTQREYLTEITNATDRMINLITALLNASRVDLGVFVVEPEPVNLAELAESVLKESEARVNNEKLVVSKNFEKDLPLISADLNIMRMIFQNLFSNAMKYTPAEGKITFSIKKDGQNILISVADTGCGIPEGAKSKIFTKMFRADNARVKDPDGSGLGLYIIKETIEKTGGKIWFESKENVGSTFYVTLPLAGMKKKEGAKKLELK